MDGEGGEVDRMEDEDESSDGDASDTELLQQITELEVAVSSVLDRARDLQSIPQG